MQLSLVEDCTIRMSASAAALNRADVISREKFEIINSGLRVVNAALKKFAGAAISLDKASIF